MLIELQSLTVDVHLYSDPSSFKSARPLLYADCEGLGGGDAAPVAMTNRKSSRRMETGADQSYYYKERILCWANSAESKRRPSIVEKLYPRILYTFSDVLVYVTRERRFVSVLLYHGRAENCHSGHSKTTFLSLLYGSRRLA